MPEPSPSFSLAVGDRVVYPNQGVCRISSVESKEVAGQRLTFVTMHREEDGAVVMVPEAKVRSIGVRKIASAKDVQAIFAFLKSDSDKATLDWKQRARTNLDRMSQGGLMGLAEVVKGLQVLSELRPLPAKERELYDNARHLLVAEVSASLNTTECNAEDAIDLVLFPPGRERPKRTVEEFRPTDEEGEDLGELGDDLLALGGDDLPPDEAPAESAEEEAEEAAPEEEEEAPKAKKRAKAPAQQKAAPPAPKRKVSEEETTEAEGVPLRDEPAAPKKRGRPPKAKAKAEAAPPKKPGRPPKAKPAATAPPKKRGRPPKAR